MKIITLILAVFVSLPLQAQDTDKLQPCMEIKKACENAGYQSGFQRGKLKEGKGTVKDCMYKITNSEAVSGVKVSPSVISGCKEKHEK